jgi:hypothetical protein
MERDELINWLDELLDVSNSGQTWKVNSLVEKKLRSLLPKGTRHPPKGEPWPGHVVYLHDVESPALVLCHCGSGRRRGRWKPHCRACEPKCTSRKCKASKSATNG